LLKYIIFAALLQAKLNSFSYWSLTDWMGEASQPEQLFFGGFGLFTANGIPKASYYTFTLLRSIGDTLLGKGDGWLAAKKNEEITVLICFAYCYPPLREHAIL
jgi:xylan 1,4-beta-xylosidase